MYLRFLPIAIFMTGRLLASPTEEAIALWKQRKVPEARAALRAVVTVEPENAEANHYLGLAMIVGEANEAVDTGLPFLEKAASLAPTDAKILTDFGQFSMVYAQRHTSLSYAKRGREALEAALKIDPNNLTARAVLYRYYTRAPWPFGSSSKAATQLEEIRRRDPNGAMVVAFEEKVAARQFAEIFKAYDELLAKNPEDPVVLFQYGRTAMISGHNPDRAIECLRKYITLKPTFPNAPSTGAAWTRIGDIESKRGHGDEARLAYNKALELEPNNISAAAALARLQ